MFTSITTELPTRVPVLPQSGGVFGWIGTMSAELTVALTILVGAITAVAALIVFIKSGFSLGKTVTVAVVGGILTFLVGGGMGWLVGLISETIQR